MKNKTNIDPLSQKNLFVWRSETTESFGAPEVRRTFCKWCKSLLETIETKHESYPWTDDFTQRCLLCGWSKRRINFVDEDRYPSGDVYCWRKILREFDTNSDKVLKKELGTYLKSNFSDIYSLDWRSFEKLTADIFKEHGYSVILTSPTKDKGIDIIVLNQDKTGTQAIIECKKFAKKRKVGVSLVRQLVGAAIEWEVNKAYLVTTSDFTYGARLAASDYAKKGYEIELIAAYDLLSMLKVYNEKLPPIQMLSKEMREDIIRQNKTKW